MPKTNALTSGESIKSSQCVCESGENCTRPMQSRRAERATGRIAHDRWRCSCNNKSWACVHRNKSSHAFPHSHVHSAPCRDQKQKKGKMTACAHRAECTHARLSECSVRPRSIFLVWCQRGASCVGALERATPIFVRHRTCTQDGPSPSIFRWFRLCLPCMPTLLISRPWQASSHGESISATHLLASLPSNSPRCFFIRAPITCGWNASAKRQRA